jgi:hypothetical protein
MLDESLRRYYETVKKFWFWCEDEKHIGERKFFIELDVYPESIPEKTQCIPCSCWAHLTYPVTHKTVNHRLWTDADRRAYTKDFQKQAIKDTTDSIEGRTGLSPYSKMDFNYEYMVENGILRKTTPSEESARIKVASELAKTLEPVLDKEETQHGLGKRPNG